MGTPTKRAAPARKSPRTAPGRRACGWPAAQRLKSPDFDESDGIVSETADAAALGCGLVASWTASCLMVDGLIRGVEILKGGFPWAM